jgi:hypothetical protein
VRPRDRGQRQSRYDYHCFHTFVTL